MLPRNKYSLIAVTALAMLTVLTSGCCCKKKNCSKKVNETEVAGGEPKQLIRNESYTPQASVNFKIESASIQDSILTVNVSYAGGCGTHSWDLIWTGMYMKSLPMKVSLFIHHTSENETCNDKMQETLNYNLNLLSPGRGEKLMVLLRGYEGELEFNIK